MVHSCCAVGCTNRANSGKNISFHRIPSDGTRRKQWLDAINRLEAKTRKPWNPSKYDVICSEHFHKDDFMLSRHKKIKILKNSAVPSIFAWKSKHKKNSKKVSKGKSDTPNVPCTTTTTTPVTTAVTTTEPMTPHPRLPSPTYVTAEHSYACEPDILKKKYQDIVQKLDQVQKQLIDTRRREKRAKDGIINLLQQLKEQQKISEEAQQMLQVYKDIPINLFKKPSQEYSEDQKEFATTLFYSSQKSYAYLREKLALPHPATIRRWVNSSDDAGLNISSQIKSLLKEDATLNASKDFIQCIEWDSKHEKVVRIVNTVDVGSLDGDVDECDVALDDDDDEDVAETM